MKARWVVVACVLMVCGCFRDIERDAGSFTAQDLRMVEGKVGIVLPAGVRGLNLYYAVGGLDPWFMARIEVPGPLVESMKREVEGLPNKGKSTAPFPDRITKRIAWWNPPAGALERRFSRRGDFVDVWLGDEGGRAVLYVVFAPVG